MSPTDIVPYAIAQLVELTNRADSAGFVTVFTPDATLVDGGRTFSGRDEIADWDATDNIGVGMHFTLISVLSTDRHDYEVTLAAVSRRFTGTGTMHITLRGDLILSLIIA